MEIKLAKNHNIDKLINFIAVSCPNASLPVKSWKESTTHISIGELYDGYRAEDLRTGDQEYLGYHGENVKLVLLVHGAQFSDVVWVYTVPTDYTLLKVMLRMLPFDFGYIWFISELHY